ncbi:MAG: GntR family transcriptional regulator [Spirochaetales bacterium]|jgi:DNA-binding FadR family transcriptional regulator|nr:GntR family transcriptional regulator [Spirochaetales bacterium]
MKNKTTKNTVAHYPQHERIQQKTVVAQTMEKIREIITSGLYKPGDKIPTEQELASRFGIGRSSIREAIKIFQHLGILESRVPKGTFLSGRSHISTEAIAWSILLGDDDMWEILELRQIIEEAAFLSMMTRYVRERDTFQPMIQKLETQVKNMKNAALEGSMDKLVQADYDFHAIIIKEGRSGLFLAIFKTLHAFLREEIQKTYYAMKELRDVSQDHKEIIDAIQTGNMEQAVTRHSAHFLRIRGLLSPGTLPKI